MSREPWSSTHRYREAAGRAGAVLPIMPLPTPPPAQPKPGMGKQIRVRVEPDKPKRNAYKTSWKDPTPAELASFRL